MMHLVTTIQCFQSEQGLSRLFSSNPASRLAAIGDLFGPARTRANWIQIGRLAYIGYYSSYLGIVHLIWTRALEWIVPQIHATLVQIDPWLLLKANWPHFLLPFQKIG